MSSLKMNVPTLPGQEAGFQRLFNAVSGLELRHIIVRAVENALLRDKRLTENLTFPAFAYHVRVDVIAQPREDPHMEFEAEGGAILVDAEDNDIVIDETWPRALALVVLQDSGVVDTPDIAREQAGLPITVARRVKGVPIAEEASGPMPERVVQMPGYEDLQAKVAEDRAMARKTSEGIQEARMLQRAHEGRPHKIVEDSPLAQQPPIEELIYPTQESKGVPDPRGAVGRDVEGTESNDPSLHREIQQQVQAGLSEWKGKAKADIPLDPREELGRITPASNVSLPEREEPLLPDILRVGGEVDETLLKVAEQVDAERAREERPLSKLEELAGLGSE